MIDGYQKTKEYFHLIESFITKFFSRWSFFGLGRFMRSNGSLSVIAFISTLVIFGNISAKTNNDETFLLGHWSSQKDNVQKPVQIDEGTVILDGGIVSDTQTSVSTLEDREGEHAHTKLTSLTNSEEELLGDTIIFSSRREGASDPENEGDVILYTVKSGDTFSKV
ncbi:MAG: hypothetical protein ABFQ53_03995, partial [Patescibacteria group bacterium]